MKNLMVTGLLVFCTFYVQGQGQPDQTNENPTKSMTAFYGFKVESLSGEVFDFNQLTGKKVMVVNTASKCGYTHQYEALEKLYNTYREKGFVVIGFPANNFGKQEPGTNEEIAEFCQKNYGVTFPMMAKISVKGNDIHPLYQWLVSKELNGVGDAEVTWNFQKFLIDENGNWVKSLAPKVNPLSEEVINWLKQ